MPYYNNYLAHYGVKGMKWGVRRAHKKAARKGLKPKTYTDKMREDDRTSGISRGGQKRIERRMAEGQYHTTARRRERVRQVAKAGAAIGLGMFVADNPKLVMNGARLANRVAKQTVINFVNSQAAKNAARKAAEQTFRLGNEVVKLKPWQYKVS